MEAGLEPGQPDLPAASEQGRFLPEELLHGAVGLFACIAVGFQQLGGEIGDIGSEVFRDQQHGQAAPEIAFQR